MSETAVDTGLAVDIDDSSGAKEKATAAAGAAQEQAGQLASTAKEQAGQVAGTAKEQAANVLGTATSEAKSLLSDAHAEMTAQASTQKDRAVGGLRALSKDLSSMAEKSEEQGPASRVVAEAAKRSGSFAEFLDEREPGHLLEELRTLGRRRTGGFLLGAAAIGFASGRLFKGVRADADDDAEVTPAATSAAASPMLSTDNV